MKKQTTASSSTGSSGRKNRFDELKKREKEIEIKDKSELDTEEVEDGGEESAIQDAKLQKMRDLARALSQKIGKGENGRKFKYYLATTGRMQRSRPMLPK